MSNNAIIGVCVFILFLLITSIIFAVPKWRKTIINEFKIEFGLMLLMSILVSTLLIVITSLTVSATLLDVTTEERANEIKTEKQIISLNYKQEINGSMGGFVLGVGGVSGNINTENYFYFYTKENNRYKLEKVNAENVLIEETNEVEPKIEYIKYEDVKDITSTPTNLGKALGLKEEKEENIKLGTVLNRAMGYYKGSSKKDETVLYIPVGSIMESFNPNIE